MVEKEEIESVDEIQEGDLLEYSQPATKWVGRVVEIKEDVIVQDHWDDNVRTSEKEKESIRDTIKSKKWTLYRRIEN